MYENLQTEEKAANNAIEKQIKDTDISQEKKCKELLNI